MLPHKLSQLGPALVKGDVNGDGMEDLFVGGASGQEATLYLQTQDQSFVEKPNDIFQRHKSLEDIDAVFFDSDNDGDLDLYVVSGGNEFMSNSSTYLDRLYINDGQGIFIFKRELLPSVFESGSIVKPHDFDMDGDLDLFIGTRMKPWNYPEPASSYLLINENGKFSKYDSDSLVDLGLVTDAEWFDYDNDGDSDIVVVGEWMPILAFLNNESSWESISESIGFEETNGMWQSIETSDLNGDGVPDLVLGNMGQNGLYKPNMKLYLNDYDQTVWPHCRKGFFQLGKSIDSLIDTLGLDG